MSMKTALFAALLIVSVAPAPVQAAAKPKADSKAMICRDIEETGSRLRSNRVCMTREQWETARQDAQDAIDQGQKRLMSACPPKTIC
jgi:hypothetical protein